MIWNDNKIGETNSRMQVHRVVKSIAKIANIAKLRIAIAKKSQFRKQDNPFFYVEVAIARQNNLIF